MLAFLNIGPFELLLLGAAAVLLFGGDLPDVARKAARVAGRLKGMTNDLTRELQGHTNFEDKLRRPPELDLRPEEKQLASPKAWRPVNQPPDASQGVEDAELNDLEENDDVLEADTPDSADDPK